MKAIVKLLRPHQYIKNGFVFVGPLFSREWSLQLLESSLIVFVAFSCMASAVYILNDLVDLESDRMHPVKRNRPLPSGQISQPFAMSLLVLLGAASIGLAWTVGPWVVLLVGIYFLMNVFYSWKLKHVVILDVFIISAGFMLRILAGTLGLEIAPSAWLLLCGLMITLFLGFSKRRAELLLLETSGGAGPILTRKVLDDYSPIVLELFIGVTAACTILSYGLYTVSPQTIALHGSEQLIYTLPFVVYGTFRYVFLLHSKSKGNDTAADLLTDFHMLATVVMWVICVFWIIL